MKKKKKKTQIQHGVTTTISESHQRRHQRHYRNHKFNTYAYKPQINKERNMIGVELGANRGDVRGFRTWLGQFK